MLTGTDGEQVGSAVLGAALGYDFYDSMAKSWLDEWGSYHWQYRDKDRGELGYPRVNSLLYTGGGRSDFESLPDMSPGSELVDSLYKRWSHERRVIAWVCWVDHAGCSKQFQSNRLKVKYGIMVDRNRLAREVGLIISAVATGVILNDDLLCCA